MVDSRTPRRRDGPERARAAAPLLPTAPAAGGMRREEGEGPEPDTPMLSLPGWSGPLDALLDEARAGRVDWEHLSVLALMEACVAALDAAADPPAKAGGTENTSAGAVRSDAPSPATSVLHRAMWVMMAAWLTWLRLRLLLPRDDPDAEAAWDEAEAFRRGLKRRQAIRAAADWLDARPQLGRDVFRRGAMGATERRAETEKVAALRALLRAYARPRARRPHDAALSAPYAPRPPRLWRLNDALARIGRLPPGSSYGSPPNPVTLGFLLPDQATLERLRRTASPSDPALLARSAVAGTFCAALELARQERVVLDQDMQLGEVRVCGRS